MSTATAVAERWSPWVWKAVVVLAVGIGGLWTATHGVAGADWGQVAAVLRGVTPMRLLVLAAIWLGGLGIYSLVLSAALPGLGVRRSLLLNLSGSAVANVLPLGGAVATAVNWRMVRTWGHSDGSFVAFCLLTNALDVLAKLMLPLVAVAALVTLSVHVPVVLWWMSAACAGVVLLAAAVRAVLRATAASWRSAGGSRATRGHRLLAWVEDSTLRIQGLLARQWHRLLPASAAYVAAQVALLYFALRAVGLDVPLVVVLTAAAIERLGTLVPITPGGTGIAEIGTIAWLVAVGLDPVQAVAGVLLYRVFLILMEIPLGGLLLGGWAWAHRHPTRVTAQAPEPERVAA
jgi:uncharacterized protein (TIRG00374 family)